MMLSARLRRSEEGDPARALAMLERETASLGPDCIDVLRKLVEQELHEQVSRFWQGSNAVSPQLSTAIR